MKQLKMKLITLSILATAVISSTPVLAATSVHKNTNSNTLTSVQATKLRLKKYTYANAPQSAKKQYEEDCKEANLKPDPTHKIFVYEGDSQNGSSINLDSYNYLNFNYWMAGEIANAQSTDGTHFTANIDQDYVGYNCTTQGDPVYIVQIVLDQKDGSGLVVDGIFGSRTYNAIRNFQSNPVNLLTPDGIVGPQTWMALMRRD